MVHGWLNALYSSLNYVPMKVATRLPPCVIRLWNMVFLVHGSGTTFVWWKLLSTWLITRFGFVYTLHLEACDHTMVSLKLSMMWSSDKFQGPPQLMVTALGIEVEMVFGVFHAIFYHTFIIGHSQVLGNSIHAHFKMNITISIIKKKINLEVSV